METWYLAPYQVSQLAHGMVVGVVRVVPEGPP
jgi:hypothetical protein